MRVKERNLMPILPSKPKCISFNDATIFKGDGYAYNRFALIESDNNLYIRAQGRDVDTKYLKIENYKDTTPVAIFRNQHNLGASPSRILEDAILKFYHDRNLKLGYAL